MKKRDFKKPRFSIDRTRRGDLAKQIAAGLRTAIETGYYKPGDILPPVRALAEILGVSMGIAVQAVVELREEGLISPRPCIGSVVCAKDVQLWKGHVLLVMRGDYGAYYSNVFTGVIREKLIKEGYLVSTVATPFVAGKRPDTAALSAALRQSVDLAVLVFDNLAIERCVAASGVKFILVGNRASKAKTCVASVTYNRAAAADEFVPELAKEGVRTLMEVGAEDFTDAKSAAECEGLRYSVWNIPAKDKGVQPEATEQAAMEAFAKRLSKGRSWLPDAFYFSDDYVASGALKALVAAEVKIPDDVRVVSWSNRGNGPVFPFPLMLAQIDPQSDGCAVAETALACLDARRAQTGKASDLVIGPTFRKTAAPWSGANSLKTTQQTRNKK